MKIIRQTPFEVGITPIQIQAEPTRNVVVVKATLSMTEDGRCELADVQSPCSGPTFLDEDPDSSLRRHNDYAPLKRQAEFMLVGSCRSHTGAPITQQLVSIRVGNLSKEISVFGNRYWRHGLAAMKPSEPTPFIEMPLCWEKAFGGRGFELNPVGQGIHKVKHGETERILLPNIESRSDLITSPHSRPHPSGTFPLSPTWRMRTRLAGTYDSNYMENHYPGMPPDLDPAYFQSAPTDQRQSEYWRGTETLYISGVTAGRSVYETTLPGLRPRAFEASEPTTEATLAELPLNLDTIYIDTDSMTVELTWRGACALEPELLYFTHDRLSSPMSIEDCHDRFRNRIAAIAAGEATFLPDPIPSSETKTNPDFDETRTVSAITASSLGIPVLEDESADDGLATQALPRLIDLGNESEGDEELPTMMLPSIADPADGDTLQTQALPRVSDPADDTEMPTQTLPMLQAVPDDTDMEATHALPAVEPEEPPSVLDEIRAMLVERGLDPGTLPKELSDPAQAPSTSEIDFAKLRVSATAAGLMERPEVKAIIDEMERDHEALQNQETTRHTAITPEEVIEDPRTIFIRQYESGNPIAGDFTGIDLSGVDLRGLQAEGLDLSEVCFKGANLSNAIFTDASLIQCSFEAACLTDANLDGANLTQANLAGAQANGASFQNAELFEANLKEADLRKADLSGAECGHVNLSGANLTEATCDEADFTGASLVDVQALRSSWVEARLNAVQATGIDLRDANLSNLRVSDGATLIRANVSGAKAAGSRWRESRLGESIFSFSDLSGAVFTGSHLGNVYMDGCNLKKANFQDAVLSEARLLRSDLMQATFRGANLVDADMRGSNLYECEFFRAITLGVNFALADLTGTRLENQ